MIFVLMLTISKATPSGADLIYKTSLPSGDQRGLTLSLPQFESHTIVATWARGRNHGPAHEWSNEEEVSKVPLSAAAERGGRVEGMDSFVGGDRRRCGGGGRFLPAATAERLLDLRHVRLNGVSGVDGDHAFSDAIQPAS